MSENFDVKFKQAKLVSENDNADFVKNKQTLMIN